MAALRRRRSKFFCRRTLCVQRGPPISKVATLLLLALCVVVQPAAAETAPETNEEPPGSQDDGDPDRIRSAAHAPDPDKGAFHITSLRNWYFHDFLPDGKGTDTLGFELNSAWALGQVQFTNISYIEIAAYDEAIPGMPIGNPEGVAGSATGITDLLTAFLISKKGVHHDHHHFSFGFATQIPTASDSTLGSGKWSLGPAFEYEYENGRFFAAFVALQLWSVLGDSDRKDVSMFMLKPMVTFEVFDKWKLVYMPYGMSVYWNKKPGQKVYLPIGGGIQRDFDLFSLDMAASVQFFEYVVRPDDGSKHDLRFMLEFDF